MNYLLCPVNCFDNYLLLKLPSIAQGEDSLFEMKYRLQFTGGKMAHSELPI